MIFQRKYDRARAFEREKLHGETPALEDENLADKLEKNDTLALILSALITIVPVALLFLAAVVGVGYLFMFR